MTFINGNDVASLGLRSDNLVEHATFETLSKCESALINYASQAQPILYLKKNQRGSLEAYTSAEKGSQFKISCLRIILPERKKTI